MDFSFIILYKKYFIIQLSLLYNILYRLTLYDSSVYTKYFSIV